MRKVVQLRGTEYEHELVGFRALVVKAGVLRLPLTRMFLGAPTRDMKIPPTSTTAKL